MEKLVCSGCIDDDDLREFIRGFETRSRCTYCKRRGAVVPLNELAQHIDQRLSTFYGKAVEQLPYESAEGGYQDPYQDTADLLFGSVGLELPNDDGRLANDLVDAIGEDDWCAYDWLSLELDEGFLADWESFSEVVKTQQRFFFHPLTERPSPALAERSLDAFLRELLRLIEILELLCMIHPGEPLYRARPRSPGERHRSASSLGPPPATQALQSNRMNPPGIPMLYAASSSRLAKVETAAPLVSIGRFELTRTAILIDLVDIPPVPGFFSEATRMDRLGLIFLSRFAELISQPVARDDRTHIEYIPTQVLAEFFRLHGLASGPLDGVRYPSATGLPGANIVLFATQADVVDGSETHYSKQPWIQLVSTSHPGSAPSFDLQANKHG